MYALLTQTSEWRPKWGSTEDRLTLTTSPSSKCRLISTIRAQAKALAKEMEGTGFRSMLVNGENILEQFHKVYDQKVSKYTELVG